MKINRPVDLTRDVLTLDEAVLYLRLSKPTIVKQATAGSLPGRKVASQWRFLRVELEKYLHGNSSQKTG